VPSVHAPVAAGEKKTYGGEGYKGPKKKTRHQGCRSANGGNPRRPFGRLKNNRHTRGGHREKNNEWEDDVWVPGYSRENGNVHHPAVRNELGGAPESPVSGRRLQGGPSQSQIKNSSDGKKEKIRSSKEEFNAIGTSAVKGGGGFLREWGIV